MEDLLRQLASAKPLGAIEEAESSVFGNKAAHLGRLLRAGLPVPPGFALGLSSGLARSDQDITGLLADCPSPWAVRSSSIQEDSPSRSFPGIFLTILGIEGMGELEQAISAVAAGPEPGVWQAYSGSDLPPLRIPVLVQSLIDPRSAGVAFTMHPVTGQPNILINATWGFGSAVVDGVVNPDEFELTRGGDIVRERIIEKPWKRTADGRQVDVDPALIEQPSVSLAEARAIQSLAVRIEAIYGQPQDIEWAIDQSSKLWILQTRAITTLPSTAGSHA